LLIGQPKPFLQNLTVWQNGFRNPCRGALVRSFFLQKAYETPSNAGSLFGQQVMGNLALVFNESGCLP